MTAPTLTMADLQPEWIARCLPANSPATEPATQNSERAAAQTPTIVTQPAFQRSRWEPWQGLRVPPSPLHDI